MPRDIRVRLDVTYTHGVWEIHIDGEGYDGGQYSSSDASCTDVMGDIAFELDELAGSPVPD